MQYVVSAVAVVPIRKEPIHSSEMVSQLLLGEAAEILAQEGVFYHIKCLFDGYEGWCHKVQMKVVIDSRALVANNLYSKERFSNVMVNNECHIASIGTPLPLGKKQKWIGKELFSYKKSIAWDVTTAAFTAENIEMVTSKFLNTPYLWGGRSAYGIDCSGFVQQVLKFFGKSLPRDAYLQVKEGVVIGFLQEVKCGDIAFFDDAEGKIIHVGILLNDSTIIHAYDRVKVDLIDPLGIISAENKVRTHQLRVIKRMI